MDKKNKIEFFEHVLSDPKIMYWTLMHHSSKMTNELIIDIFQSFMNNHELLQLENSIKCENVINNDAIIEGLLEKIKNYYDCNRLKKVRAYDDFLNSICLFLLRKIKSGLENKKSEDIIVDLILKWQMVIPEKLNVSFLCFAASESKLFSKHNSKILKIINKVFDGKNKDIIDDCLWHITKFKFLTNIEITKILKIILKRVNIEDSMTVRLFENLSNNKNLTSSNITYLLSLLDQYLLKTHSNDYRIDVIKKTLNNHKNYSVANSILQRIKN